ALLYSTISILAQAPEMFSYQSVIRDEGGDLVSNHEVGFRASIREGSPTGNVVYRESHVETTNENGLLSVAIGNGAVPGTMIGGVWVLLYDFAEIDWANGPFYLETEFDLEGGSNYHLSGASQLLSVPFALYAKSVESVKRDFYIGQDTLGGIVYFLYEGSDGQQHGLIVSKTETTAKWQNFAVYEGADRTEDGVFNTNHMTDSPAKDWVETHGEGWYLPAIDELVLLWSNRFHVNQTSRIIGSTLLSTTENYWCSTEEDGSYAFYFSFKQGRSYSSLKQTIYNVRAIRKF
ncbi:MAG TPA: hypothetical protein PLV65_02060, partial [Tenuifilaceae bacterium]|nr:hypothetical protein [Tenuifilaceae bacterium]